MTTTSNTPTPKKKLRKTGFTLLLFITVFLAAYFGVRLSMAPFKPVTLSPHEQQEFDQKIEHIQRTQRAPAYHVRPLPLKPQRYQEPTGGQPIRFTEKELNSLIAQRTDLADKLAFDLSDDMLSARLRLPIDPDVPIFGGQTLNAKAGLTITSANGETEIILEGITVMGFPLPSAWIGNLKNIDLVAAAQQGNASPFWELLADGISQVKIEDGTIRFTLSE